MSSRTPEGRPGRCPVCGGAYRIEASLPPGDAVCPRCGALVWPRAKSVPGAARPARFVNWVAAATIAAAVFLGGDRYGIGTPEKVVLLVIGALLFRPQRR